MHIEDHARLAPAKAAIVNGSNGRVTSYRELDRKSLQLARVLQACGLEANDTVGVAMESGVRLLEVFWAGLRSGLQMLPLDATLDESEMARRCEVAGVRALVASDSATGATEALAARIGGCATFLMTGVARPGWQSLDAAQRTQEAGPLSHVPEGRLLDVPPGTTLMQGKGLTPESVYFSPAGLRHPATCIGALETHRAGGVVVVMDAFDPQESLRLMERYHVTHGVWRSEMFAQMLALPEPIRNSYILNSMRCALHETEPLPPELNQAMRAWWGPVFGTYDEPDA